MTQARFGTSLVALAAGVFGSLAVAHAAGTRAWSTATFKEFDEGEGDHVLVSSRGGVSPGRALESTSVGADAAWAAARLGDGSVVVGGVADGLVRKVSAGKVTTLADLSKETPWIGALAAGKDGTVYAGTLATGSVHAIKDGKATKLVTLDDATHVWALAWDTSGKTLYAATGPSAKVFAIDVAAKKARLVVDLDEDHALALAVAADGALWIGTSDDAVLYRVDPRGGAARAMADFAGTEVKAVIEHDGAFLVGVNDFDKPVGGKGKGQPGKSADTGAAPGAVKLAPEQLPSRPGERKGKGTLWRVEADGRLEQLHALSDAYFTGLAAQDDVVYAATGTYGKVYAVRADRTVATAFDVEERQVVAIWAAGADLGFLTSDAAKVFKVGGAAGDARYTSKVWDAQAVSRWGMMRWRAENDVVLETRSGNTADPAKGWGSWQPLSSPGAAPGGARAGRIVSPPGRYLQFRASFPSKTGALRDLVAYAVPQNLRARVTDVTVGETTDPNKKTPVTTASGATKPRSPIVKLRWKVENPDDDELSYVLEVRREGDGEWRKVPLGDDVYTKTDFDWNTEALPDGVYRLRLTASDARANDAGRALDDVFVTPPFVLDNSRPQLTGLVVKDGVATARAADTLSRIDELSWSIDGGDWQVAFPKDGVFDDTTELFSVRLPNDLGPGSHTLEVRVADEGDNIGAAAVTFKVGK